LDNNQLTTEIIKAPQKALMKLAMVNPSTKLPMNQKTIPLIIKEKIPRVIIFNGRVRILIIGFIKKLKSVRHAPTTKTTPIELMMIPSKNWAVNQIEAETINHLNINFIL
jgi:hypothetical protein